MIWDVSPSETPVLSAIKRTKAKGTNHEWQTDRLAPAGANAHIEGDDAAPVETGPTVRLSNYTQILKKHVIVSGTQEAVDKAGRKSEVAYQKARRLKEIKLDLEWAMLNGGGADGIGSAKAVGVDDSTPRKMGSIQTYLATNASVGATGAVAAGDGTNAMSNGTNRDFTESMLTTVLESCYTEGGDPKLLAVSPTNKGVVSGFTGGGAHYVDKDDKKLVNAVDIYVGDFHTLKVVPARNMAKQIVLAIDPRHLAYAELRSATSKQLGNTGDSYKEEIVMEGTLEVCNEKAHGIIADTNG